MVNIFEHYELGEKLYQQVVSNVYKKYNLTYMEFTIIMFIANNDYDTASDIVKYRSLTKSHVSISIKSLVEKGLIEETYLKNDRRTKHLKLTSNSNYIVRDGRKAQKGFINILNSGLSKSDVDMLKSFIDKINDNIKNNLIDKRYENE